ncbi:GAF domain-like protein [Spinellus fusiger]|nr:GAF domain-like protein [Spinellus fusiger]
MKELHFNPTLSKKEFYQELLEQVHSITQDQTYWVKSSVTTEQTTNTAKVTNLSNVSSLLYHGLSSLPHFQEKPINWAGFYVTDPRDSTRLVLGPFQGKVACTMIPFGKGVCGTAASTQTLQLVKDVHAFPGHIACDSASNSEIVVPIIKDKRVLGVLDIDCEAVEGFDTTDSEGLQAIVDVLLKNCVW